MLMSFEMERKIVYIFVIIREQIIRINFCVAF